MLRRKVLRSKPLGATAKLASFRRPLRGRRPVLRWTLGGGKTRGWLVSNFLGGERERGVWRRSSWGFRSGSKPPSRTFRQPRHCRWGDREERRHRSGRHPEELRGWRRRGLWRVGLRETLLRAPAALVAQAPGGGFAQGRGSRSLRRDLRPASGSCVWAAKRIQAQRGCSLRCGGRPSGPTAASPVRRMPWEALWEVWLSSRECGPALNFQSSAVVNSENQRVEHRTIIRVEGAIDEDVVVVPPCRHDSILCNWRRRCP